MYVYNTTQLAQNLVSTFIERRIKVERANLGHGHPSTANKRSMDVFTQGLLSAAGDLKHPNLDAYSTSNFDPISTIGSIWSFFDVESAQGYAQSIEAGAFDTIYHTKNRIHNLWIILSIFLLNFVHYLHCKVPTVSKFWISR